MVVRYKNRILVEGQDFHVHIVRMPNRSTPAQVWPNSDDTYDIYLNGLYWTEEDRMRREFDHEIRHILLRHFEAVGLTIQEIEREANGEKPVQPSLHELSLHELSLHDFLHPPEGTIPCFGSDAGMAEPSHETKQYKTMKGAHL